MTNDKLHTEKDKLTIFNEALESKLDVSSRMSFDKMTISGDNVGIVFNNPISRIQQKWIEAFEGKHLHTFSATSEETIGFHETRETKRLVDREPGASYSANDFTNSVTRTPKTKFNHTFTVNVRTKDLADVLGYGVNELVALNNARNAAHARSK